MWGVGSTLSSMAALVMEMVERARLELVARVSKKVTQSCLLAPMSVNTYEGEAGLWKKTQQKKPHKQLHSLNSIDQTLKHE